MSQLKDTEHLKISLKDIEIGTKNFEDCIGKGGYGLVYKGELVISGKPTVVAVKRLDEKFGQGSKEFLTEIWLLSGQKHPNLITLLGFCDEGKEKILVYEYAERGSLDTYLRSSTTTNMLTWLERLKICIDAARGLDYLHNHFGKHQAVIHRDIKSANILIDGNWVAKISDLGLSKLSLAGLDRSEVVSQACGTRGYCEPEYFETNIVTKESDIYSFGIVLFEVLLGRLCTIKDDDGFLLSCSLAREYYEKRELDKIVDPTLKGEMCLDSMNKFAGIAYRCIHEDRGHRPPMGDVLKELEESLQFQVSSIVDDGKKTEVISSAKPSSSMKSFIERVSQNSSSGTEPQSSSSEREPRSSSSEREVQSSSSERETLRSILERESQISTSESYPDRELRLEKVMRIFKQFDLNKDGGLNREELKALLIATNSDFIDYSEQQINTELDEVFCLYDMFINGEKGLTCNGLFQIYDDGDADLEYDFQALKHGLKPFDHNEHCLSKWDRSEKVWRIFRQFDLNEDGGLNRQELAAFIVATNRNVSYGEEEISTYLSDFLNVYDKYIDGEKGLTCSGLLLSYDECNRDLDFDFGALGLQLNSYIDHEVALGPRRRNLVHLLQSLLMALISLCIFEYSLRYLAREFCQTDDCKRFITILREVIFTLNEIH